MGYNKGMKNRLTAIICAVLAVLVVLALVFWPHGDAEPVIYDGMKVYAFEAGKADAFLIYDDDFAVLLDTGEKELGDTILDYLAAEGISRLDYLIISHFDKDHVGSAAKILKNIEVGQILQSNYPKDSKVYEKYLDAAVGKNVQTVREDMEFSLGKARFVVDAPAVEEYAEDLSNNSSLIVSVFYGKTRWLFMGDAEDARLGEWLAENADTQMETTYDFLKVPHHGKYQRKLGDLVVAVWPKYAVITSSDDEPEDDVAAVYLRTDANLYLTRRGAVLFSTDGENIAASR